MQVEPEQSPAPASPPIGEPPRPEHPPVIPPTPPARPGHPPTPPEPPVVPPAPPGTPPMPPAPPGAPSPVVAARRGLFQQVFLVRGAQIVRDLVVNRPVRGNVRIGRIG